MEYQGQLKGFPEEVVNKMLERQVEQGNSANVSIFENRKGTDKDAKGFTWKETPEGWEFWYEVITRQKFQHFFEKYPKKDEVLYTAEYLRKNMIAIHCPTQDDADAICDKFFAGSRDWKDYYNYYKEKTCYSLYSGGYTDKDYFESKGYTIIPAQTILNQTNKMKKITGYRVKPELRKDNRATFLRTICTLGCIHESTPTEEKVNKALSVPAVQRHFIDAGVWELWFEPVYGPQEVVLTLGSNNARVTISEGKIIGRGGIFNVEALTAYVHNCRSAQKDLGPYAITCAIGVRCHRIGCPEENNLFSLDELEQVLEAIKSQQS